MSMEARIVRALARGCGASATLLVLTAACAEPAARPPASAVRDSAGVRIVQSARPVWSDGEGWRVGDVILEIGAGPDGDLFGVQGAARLPGGVVAVALGGLGEVRFYGADGTLRSSHGRPGEGPGEFRMLAALGPAGGDTVWAWDYGAGRASLITAVGGVAATVTPEPTLPQGVVVGRRKDGSWVLGQAWGSPDPSAPRVEGLVRGEVVFVLHDARGRRLATLGVAPGREVVHRPEGGRMTMGTVPFARTASHALVGDDLVVGDQVAHQLTVLGTSGATTSIRWAGGSLALGAEDISSWKRARIDGASTADRPSIRRYLEDVPAPATRPAYGRVLADPAGALWVARHALPDAVEAQWDVFDPSGHWLGPVRMPEAFEPLEIGSDYALGVARDALAAERIALYVLTRGR